MTSQAALPFKRATAEQPRLAPGSLSGLGPCFFYIAVEFGRPMDWFPILGVIRPGVIAAIWGALAVVYGRQRPIPRPLWFILGLMAVMTWNVPWAVNNAWAFWGLRDFAKIIFGGVLPLVLLPKSFRGIQALLTFFVLVHVPTAIWGLLNMGRGMGGWMADENDLALSLNVAIALGFYLVLESRSLLKRLVLLTAIGVMLASIVASMSRGGVVGLAAVGLFMLMYGPYRTRLLIGLLLVCIGFLAFAPPAFWHEVESIGTAHEYGDTGEQRFYLWGMAWRMFLDYPLFGVGTLNYGIRAPEYENTERAETTGFHTWGRVAHSIYLTALSEQGLVGTFFFAATIVWCVKSCNAIRRTVRLTMAEWASSSVVLLSSGLLAAIFAVLVTGVFLSVLYYPVVWVLIGLLAALVALFGAERASPAPVQPTHPTRSSHLRKAPVTIAPSPFTG